MGVAGPHAVLTVYLHIMDTTSNATPTPTPNPNKIADDIQTTNRVPGGRFSIGARPDGPVELTDTRHMHMCMCMWSM